MNALNILLDKMRETRSLPSDNALSHELGVTRATISNWRHGRNYPDPVACARIAEMTGEPLARVLGIVGEARALSTEEKRVWRRLASAAALALCAVLAPVIAGESTAYAAGFLAMPIMSIAAWVAFRLLQQNDQGCCLLKTPCFLGVSRIASRDPDNR